MSLSSSFKKLGNKEHTFIEEIMYCPSQIYYFFTDAKSGEKYCIYLRWRYRDPWTSYLVKCDDDYELQSKFDPLETHNQYKEDDYCFLEEDVLDIIKEKFPETQFPSKIERHIIDIGEYFENILDI